MHNQQENAVFCYNNGADSIVTGVNCSTLQLCQQTEPSAFTFVLDLSGSMKAHIGTIQSAMIRILDKLKVGSAFAIVAFGDQAVTLFETLEFSSEERIKCSNALKSIGVMGITNLEAGLQMANSIAAKRSNPKCTQTLIMTDGMANVGHTTPDSLAAIASAS
jgi:Mg-chelatase subunit ChlD